MAAGQTVQLRINQLHDFVEGRGFPAAPRQQEFSHFAVASFTHRASLARYPPTPF
jgi:hypothetical protein